MVIKLRHALLCVVSIVLYVQFYLLSIALRKREESARTCAINFFGLPRAFQSLVLPSLEKYVLPYNIGCDFFVHYYHVSEEQAGRSGAGGKVDPTQIHLLKQAVQKIDPKAHVEFIYDTEEGFWKQYTPLIHKIRTTNDTKTGKYLYYPWRASTYKYPSTTDNIVKMWHSIDKSFRSMEEYQLAHNFEYQRVAMMRSDVVYMTPIDVWNISSSQRDTKNQHFVMASFGKHPVNDRIILGPMPAVRAWALNRFQYLDQHVQMMLQRDPGFGMHSERFIAYTLVPLMEKLGYTQQNHPTMCFFRARADESVWVSDCQGSAANPKIMQALGDNTRQRLKELLHRPCGPIEKLTHTHRFVRCPS